MSNHSVETIKEDLVDEFYDNVDSARDWLEYDKHVVTSGLSYDELCDLFVQYSLADMQ